MKKIFTIISIFTLACTIGNAQNITNVAVVDVTCNTGMDGVINVSTDATVGFDYELELFNGFWQPFLQAQTAPTFPNFSITGLFAGTFRLTTYVTGGIPGTPISTFSNIVIAQPAPLFISAPPTVLDVSCFGGNDGSIALSVFGGTMPYTFSWSNGSNLNPVTGLLAGTYTCTIIDASGCASIASTSIVLQPAAPLTTTITSSPVSCFGGNNGTATVAPNGGTAPYTFVWSDGQTTNPATLLSAGNYSCIITDANFCTVTSNSETVTQPLAPLTAGSTNTDVSCFGGSDGDATVFPNGGTPGYTFSWSNGQTTNPAINLLPGTYICTITDANLCTVIESVTVTQPAGALLASAARLSFTYPLYNNQDITCNGLSDGEAEAWGTNGTSHILFYGQMVKLQQ
jgi:hypothetical protein